MSQNLFPKWTNYLPTLAAIAVVTGGAVVVSIVAYFFGPTHTDVGYQPEQPIHYSHQLHAGQLGMDCRYCHNTVEYAAHSAIPPTSTCMNCHGGSSGKGIHWNGLTPTGDLANGTSPEIAKLHAAHDAGLPVEWEKVHLLPDYAYFNHSVHLNLAGDMAVGCVECHGRIDQMEVVYQVEPLSMGWCLECHRDPAPHLRPKNEATNMRWLDEISAEELAAVTQSAQKLVENGEIAPPEHCSACHR